MTIHKRKRLHSALKCFSYVIHILWNHGCVHQIYFLNQISRHNILPGNVEANIDFHCQNIWQEQSWIFMHSESNHGYRVFYIICLVEDVIENEWYWIWKEYLEVSTISNSNLCLVWLRHKWWCNSILLDHKTPLIRNIIQTKFYYDEWESFYNEKCFYISQIYINDDITNHWIY